MLILKTRKQLTIHGLVTQEITPMEIGQMVVNIKPPYLAHVTVLTAIVHISFYRV